MRDYKAIAYKAKNPSDRGSVLRQLDTELPSLFEREYRTMTRSPMELLTVTMGEKTLNGSFVSTLFDHVSGHRWLKGASGDKLRQHTEDRVVAVWGVSRSEPGSTRDKARMKGFIEGAWSGAYGGYDRGHFFAHTMGGGLDINLFPQLAAVNRRGLWREMETYCAKNPGTFSFVRPIYAGSSWKPVRLEYGVFKMPPRNPLDFWGAEFGN